MKSPSTDTTLPARMAALQRIIPFHRMAETELGCLAEMLSARTYAPGAVLHRGGEPLARLLVVVRGSVRTETGELAGPVCGLASLFGASVVGPLAADATTGAEVMWMNKHTFFTLARECPEVVRGFLETGPAGGVVGDCRSDD